MAGDSAFLGRGWGFPPTFTKGGARVTTVAGEEDIHQSLQILFATRPGERTMLQAFGCDLDHILFEEIDQGLITSLTRIIEDAVLYHEPRITLNSLDVNESEQEPGLLLITIDYSIRGTNSRYNMVYPFYLKEAVNPGVRSN